jgi:NADH-quinone oxidoreductase subunit L
METIILFAPLAGALIAGFGWKLIGETAALWVSTGMLFLSALLSWIVFLTFDGATEQIQVLRFIESGTFSADWMIRMDRLTAIMLIVVTTVSSLVHLYSFGYMNNDPQWKEGESYKPRFFAYLSFFTFAMLALVTADNLVQMFFGWEGVGVASYLLIGFYYRKPSANAAAIKAFVVNRIGDFGFALGIFALFFLVDSVRFDDIFAAGPMLAETQISFLWRDWNAANLIAFLLFVGAMGKSAQLFLHTWLPDAMEGPTPVSALIHAATMVTAGVFLVVRMSPLMEFAPEATTFIVIIGAATAFFAASVALVQTDIKRVIAYSTCSQLGYMFVAAGVGAYSVAMFHLLTHAFFKALLFLGAGSVITAMHHEQEMTNFGALRKKIPFTYWGMMIGTLAITGVGVPLTTIGFAGFLSKDAIIESAYGAQTAVGDFAFWLLVIAAFMTSFYSWRLMFMTFFGEARGNKDTHDHAHESPRSMLIPLGVLAIGAALAGMIWVQPFFGKTQYVAEFYGIPYAEAAKDEGGSEHDAGEGEKPAYVKYAFTGKPGEGAIYFGPDNDVLDAAHASPKWVKVSPFFAMILGLGLAFLFYIVNPSLPVRLAQNQRPLYLFLKNKWYFDEIYNVILMRPMFALGRLLWKRGDGNVIDGFLNGVAMGVVPFFTRLAGKAQSGFIFTYAFWMVLGIVALVTWMSIGGGAK